MSVSSSPHRTLSLLGATGVGVGAIVGGGILALAGVAFATTGPGAIAAFALNGVVAFLTAASFAELAVRFPQSGGTYTYARKVLTVETAFAVGWIVWFASIVAAVLYALGFAVFFVPVVDLAFAAFGRDLPGWLSGRFAVLAYALAAVGYYVWTLSRTRGGGGQWATVGKVVVFAILILGGLWALLREMPSIAELTGRFRPFLTQGGSGLAQAMGYTFIALQGFDLIAAVGGEVKDPERNIPRAMFLSLATALGIYIPLLTLIVAVGTDGVPVAEMAAANPETMVAEAARNFLGVVGYWLVIVAGVLSMLSALQANMLAASRFARTMALDRTLPPRFAELEPGSAAPVAAVWLTGATVTFVLVAVPDVAAAGAASSLIFLGSFGLTHTIAYLARRRAGTAPGFRTPWFPMVPATGGAACLALGLYQAVAVPEAGVLIALWLSAGAVLFALYLAPRARAVDALSEGADPEMIRLRGRRPLILVPIANPAKAETLVSMSRALAPPGVSRVQLLSVVPVEGDGFGRGLPKRIRDAQSVLGGALKAAIQAELRPEALITLHDDPWQEIERVARITRPEKLLLGFGHLQDAVMLGPLERLIERVSSDVVILRAPGDWRPYFVRKILVPSAGSREQSPIRARILGSLLREAPREVTFLGVVPEDAPQVDQLRLQRQVGRIARDEVGDEGRVEIARADDVIATIVERAADADLVILGLHSAPGRRGVFSRLIIEVARSTETPLIMIGQRR